MKFCIFGAGGTGGVLAAYLAMAGNDVTLIARGKHLAAIREQGLTLHTNHRGTEQITNVKACTVEAYADMPDALKAGSTMSMQRDIQWGGNSEFAGLVNRVVELGQEYHVAVPLYQQVADWGKKNL